KKLIFLLLAFFIITNGVVVFGEDGGDLTAEYEALQKNLAEKAKAINSRDTYKKFMEERKESLNALLQKVESAKADDSVVLLNGRLLLDLRKWDAALEKFEVLIKKNSPRVVDAKFGKIKILLQKEKTEAALALFEEIEAKLEKDKKYFRAIYEFAFSVKDVNKRIAFSNQFIESAADTKEFTMFKGYMYENLADIEKNKGDVKKAVEILEKGIEQMKEPRSKRSLESVLAQLKMLNGAAPEINAEQWVNSETLTLAGLKGKAVVIDFWAPWCGPCRRVTPLLVKNYKKLKGEGLVVIGFTKLYGRYSDDTQNKGKVDAEEESALIKEYVKRNEIVYPVAIANERTVFDTYGVTGIPTMVLIDKEGNVSDISVGVGDESKLEEKIKALLKP
ncbi:MAG: redoxin domain-containing protein, partial [bacterium]|nr:redoxin domain-containing protein [bacterium]